VTHARALHSVASRQCVAHNGLARSRPRLFNCLVNHDAERLESFGPRCLYWLSARRTAIGMCVYQCCSELSLHSMNRVAGIRFGLILCRCGDDDDGSGGPACSCVTFSLTKVTWLILPVVICLSQRLSHACLSINIFIP
jgi:hypothetical protein